ncbi:GntR family transcriptional regulator [Deltaproteobacteria bacterium]|nr:GntR family transcriptional regulator [Deltaproteobacteria bacterium]
MEVHPAVSTKNEAMYQALRQELLSGALRPAQRLIISSLAEKHHVSPMPVREAIKRLQQEGLVDVVPHIGAVVKTLDFPRYRDVVEVRNQLEILAIMTATERMTLRALKKLDSLISRMEKSITAGNMPKVIVFDRKFHFAIYENAPNTFLVENVSMLWDKCNISPYVFAWDAVRAVESLNEHKRILDAIKNKQAAVAGDLLRRHKERSLERLRIALDVSR